MWQDLAMSLISLCLIYALIPQIIAGFKLRKSSVAKQTSIITFLGLFVQAVIFLTLNLHFSAVISILASLCWYLLLIQSAIWKN